MADLVRTLRFLFKPDSFGQSRRFTLIGQDGPNGRLVQIGRNTPSLTKWEILSQG